MNDADLIARVVARDDRHAFAELVRRHQSAVRRLLRRLTGDAARADDLAQETFLKAYQGLAKYRGGGRFSTWLYTIAWHLFVSDVRRPRATPEVATEHAASDSERIDARADLEKAMEVLRPEERAALALTYGQDVSHEEAAAILDCPLGTLKTHVARAKEKLRRRLAEDRP